MAPRSARMPWVRTAWMMALGAAAVARDRTGGVPWPTNWLASVFQVEGWGWIGLVASERGLRALFLPRADRGRGARWPCASIYPEARARRTIARVGRGRAGRCRPTSRANCGRSACRSISAGTPRLRSRSGRQRPASATVRRAAYRWIADQIGGGGAGIYQAVGSALGANPVPLVIPCHRVVGSDGSLHGYAGGLDLKLRLLAWRVGKGPWHFRPMRIAVLGDIHGNLFGLQAVLADLRGQSPDALVISGDLVYKFPWGAEVVDLLRALPCRCILGNAELYVPLWGTELWPQHWQEPLMIELAKWERERLGPERVRWLAQLPGVRGAQRRAAGGLAVVARRAGQPVPADSGSRPGTIARRGCRRTTGAPVARPRRRRRRRVRSHAFGAASAQSGAPDGGETLVVSPGTMSYGRGREKEVGRADYALLDWSQQRGWQATLRPVRYDPEPVWQGLLQCRGDFPVASNMANRMRPPGDGRRAPSARRTSSSGPGATRRYGGTSATNCPAWRALRGEDD